MMQPETKKIIQRFLVPAAFAALAVWSGFFQHRPDFLLHINFYDVGQGDSIFIQTYLGNQILIDGGPSDTVLSHLGNDMPFFDRTIDLVILTHPHADHVTGLTDVLKRYKVKKVLLPEVSFDSGPFQEFLRLLQTKKIEVVFAKQGQRIYLDSATVFDIYHPLGGKMLADNSPKKKEINPNDASIVGKLSFGKTKILLTGDAGFDIENKILPEFDLDSDVLKVGHQGSKFSSSSEFLQEVTPQFAVISVGKNSYGHPTDEAMGRIKGASAEIFRTDQDKTIRFVSDGTNLYRK